MNRSSYLSNRSRYMSLVVLVLSQSLSCVRLFYSYMYLVCFCVIALGFLGATLFYYRKSKVTEQQLEFELADIRNIANVTPYE